MYCKVKVLKYSVLLVKVNQSTLNVYKVNGSRIVTMSCKKSKRSEGL